MLTRFPLSFLLLLWATLISHAQVVGDTQEKVVQMLGKPSAARVKETEEIWLYPDGTRIVLSAGKVVESSLVERPESPPPEAVSASRPVPRSQIKETRPAPVKIAEKGSVAFSKREKSLQGFGLLLIIVGVVLGIIWRIAIIVEAFAASIAWGIGVIFVPFVTLIFALTHWSDVKKPLLLTYLVAVPLILAGAGLRVYAMA